MKPGSLVVCVNAQNISHPEFFSALPEEGKTYIVREVAKDPRKGREHNSPGVLLEEIVGRTILVEDVDGVFPTEARFKYERFREVLPPDSYKTAIDEIMAADLTHPVTMDPLEALEEGVHSCNRPTMTKTIQADLYRPIKLLTA